MAEYKYIFGPVKSRRFGRSLGVDMTPGKTCSLNCVFCQLGKSDTLTLERREYVPTGEVLDELRHWADHDGKADYVTLAGSGEPTLHSKFGDVLDFVRNTIGFRAVLLSNGTTFWIPEVRRDACKADTVKLSLSAWDQASFRRINRACAGLDFECVVAGQKVFRNKFEGQLLLEVFVVNGLNSSAEDMGRIAALAAGIKPDVVQLNTAVRPVAEPGVTAVDMKSLRRLADIFDPPATIIASFPPETHGRMALTPKSVLAAIKRHPSTAADVAESCGVALELAEKTLVALVESGKLTTDKWNGGTYYSAR